MSEITKTFLSKGVFNFIFCCRKILNNYCLFWNVGETIKNSLDWHKSTNTASIKNGYSIWCTKMWLCGKPQKIDHHFMQKGQNFNNCSTSHSGYWVDLLEVKLIIPSTGLKAEDTFFIFAGKVCKGFFW